MNIAVILAGGVGTRMGADIPKQFITAGGKPVIIHTLERFAKHGEINGIIVVCVPQWIDYMQKLIVRYSVDKIFTVVPGGSTRRESSLKGALEADRILSEMYGEIYDGNGHVLLMHDAARPFVSERIISENIKAALEKGACETVIKVNDTVLRGKGGLAQEIIPRDEIYLVQTPQSFTPGNILRAHREVPGDAVITDDAGLVLAMGGEVALVDGARENVKITTPEDLKLF